MTMRKMEAGGGATVRGIARLRFNRRQYALIAASIAALLVVSVWLAGLLLSSEPLSTRLELRNMAPSADHPFGTDWLGRDMFTRTIKGLALSISVGMTAAAASVVVASLMGIAAAMGRTADRIVSWLIDLFLSVPHLVTLILIAFVFGGGMKGVIVGVALTHWPSLARVIRAEVLQLKTAEYVQISRRLGKSRWWTTTRHMLPHLLPAIGIILSESMRYLSTGLWWLAFFPGLSLLLVVRAFDVAGDQLRVLLDPRQTHE
ncbi:MAG: peptide transporter permease [Paenibacillus sp.]|nr:peptide transporter permease [Paenibacillus sp.]